MKDSVADADRCGSRNFILRKRLQSISIADADRCGSRNPCDVELSLDESVADADRCGSRNPITWAIFFHSSAIHRPNEMVSSMTYIRPFLGFTI